MGDTLIDSTTDMTTASVDSPSTTPTASVDTTATTVTTPATTPPAVPTKFLVGEDGKFSDSWKDKLPEELRGEACLDNVTDLPNMAKQLVSLKKMVGRDKLVIPKEGDPEEVVDAYRKALGIPNDPNGYTITVPDDLKGIFTDERMANAKALAHKLGISETQFSEYMQSEMQAAVALLESEEAEQVRLKEEAEKTLRTEFGAAYDERMHAAKRLVAEAIPDEEARMSFLERFGNDPDFIRFVSTVGARMTESKALVDRLQQDTPGDAMKEIAKLQQTPGYLDINSDMSREERDAISTKIRDLYKIVYPDESRTRLG